jgi:hypothetical protein
VKKVLLIIIGCLGGILVPITLIYSLPIQTVQVPIGNLTGYQFKIFLPESAVLFLIGGGLIVLGQIGRKILLNSKKR